MPRTSAPDVAPSAAPIFEMPRFNGFGSVQEFIRLYQKNCIRNGWDESQRTRFLPAFLDGSAKCLWDGLPDEEEPKTWDSAVELLTHIFSANDDVSSIESELFQRRQSPSEKYVEYEQCILSLLSRLGRVVEEDEKIRMIIRGLNDDLFQHVFLAEPRSLKELSKVANRCERLVVEINRRQCGYKFPTSPAKPAVAGWKESAVPCRTSSRRTDTMRTTDGTPVCFKCQYPGHVSKFCPRIKIPVVSHVLTTTVIQDASSFVQPIFPKISCKINGRIASAIVDTGAAITAVSDDFVFKNAIYTTSAPELLIRTPGGQVIRSPRTADVMLTANNISEERKVIVLSDLPTDVLIGMDWIMKHSPVLDFCSTNILTSRFDKEKILTRPQVLEESDVLDDVTFTNLPADATHMLQLNQLCPKSVEDAEDEIVPREEERAQEEQEVNITFRPGDLVYLTEPEVRNNKRRGPGPFTVIRCEGAATCEIATGRGRRSAIESFAVSLLRLATGSPVPEFGTNSLKRGSNATNSASDNSVEEKQTRQQGHYTDAGGQNGCPVTTFPMTPASPGHMCVGAAVQDDPLTDLRPSGENSSQTSLNLPKSLDWSTPDIRARTNGGREKVGESAANSSRRKSPSPEPTTSGTTPTRRRTTTTPTTAEQSAVTDAAVRFLAPSCLYQAVT